MSNHTRSRAATQLKFTGRSSTGNWRQRFLRQYVKYAASICQQQSNVVPLLQDLVRRRRGRSSSKPVVVSLRQAERRIHGVVDAAVCVSPCGNGCRRHNVCIGVTGGCQRLWRHRERGLLLLLLMLLLLGIHLRRRRRRRRRSSPCCFCTHCVNEWRTQRPLAAAAPAEHNARARSSFSDYFWLSSMLPLVSSRCPRRKKA